MATGRVPTTANSPLTAKGDLFGYSTAPVRLAVGNDGEQIVADSSTSTGLRYQGSTAAGKNRIINGAMDFWQRNTTFGPTASTGIFTADRWNTTLNANTYTLARETSIVPTGFQYSYKLTAGTGGTALYLYQLIETQNCQDLAGKTVTLSAYCATSTSSTVDFIIYYNTAVDAGPAAGGWTAISTTTLSTTSTMPNAPQSAQFAIPSTAKTIFAQIKTTGNLAANATLCVTGVQLELGSVATAFSRAGGTIQGELAACQRYYWRDNGATNSPTIPVSYQVNSTTLGGNNPVVMRIAPSVSATYQNANYGTAWNLSQPTRAACTKTGSVASSFFSTPQTWAVCFDGGTFSPSPSAFQGSASNYFEASAEL
jgi:hypothetical protein